MSSPNEDNLRTSNMYDIMDNDIENKPIPPPEPTMDPVMELFLRRGLRPHLRPALPVSSSLGAHCERRGPHIVPPPGATRVPPLTSLGGWDEIITKDCSCLPEKRPYSSGFLNYMRYSHKTTTDEEKTPSTDVSQNLNAEADKSLSIDQSQLYSDKLKSATGELLHLSHNTSLEDGEPHFKKMKTEVGESPSPHAVIPVALNKTVDELTNHLLPECVRANNFTHFASFYPAIVDLPDPDEEDTADSKLF